MGTWTSSGSDVYLSGGKVGINNASPSASLDVVDDSQTVGLLVRHSNLTQGIGIGYNTIAANGSNTNQDLNIAAKGTGLDELMDAVELASRGDVVALEMLVPYGSENVLAALRRIGGVETTEYVEGGTLARGWAPRHAAARFQAFSAVPHPPRARSTRRA